MRTCSKEWGKYKFDKYKYKYKFDKDLFQRVGQVGGLPASFKPGS